MATPRVWLVTVKDRKGNFIDQRRIEAFGQASAESYAYDWIKSKGGDTTASTIVEVTS
jgi:hypothetical protein